MTKKIIESFIYDGVPVEKMVMAINALRIIILRNNNALDKDQINYICSFREYKNKSIQSAAKSFINAIRDVLPELLNKEFQLYIKNGQID